MYVQKRKDGKFQAVQTYKDPLSEKTRKVTVTIEKDTSRQRNIARLEDSSGEDQQGHRGGGAHQNKADTRRAGGKLSRKHQGDAQGFDRREEHLRT